VIDRAAIVVAAAVIRRGELFLVTRRLKGTHLAGYWEFPGGKCEPDESCASCLAREIQEELGCGVRIRDEILTVAHAYPARPLELHFFECDLVGEPAPLLGQEIRWVAREQLTSLEFPPADAELIRNLVEG
jgi:8-oxo-dGTP diphosphatase